MAKLRLTFACEDGPFKRPIIDGSIRPDGIDLASTVAHSSEIIWRQLSRAEFDISELSLSSFLILRAQGDERFVGLPVFPSRRFFHTNCLVRADRGIARPEDLRGKRVGIPEYQVTSLVWTRGALQHEFGVQPEEIEWWVERTSDRSHAGVTSFVPPSGIRVQPIPAANSIGSMMVSGELDATFSYIAEPNAVDRSRIDLDRQPMVRPLFPDVVAEGARYFRKTALHPVNHLIVVRRSILSRHPWVALNLYKAFAEARERVLAETRGLIDVYFSLGILPEADRLALSAGALPYGVRSNRKMLETIARYVKEQGIAPQAVSPSDLFAPSTLEV
jgi:4,5-dihydroxyphthalate decarboxylase